MAEALVADVGMDLRRRDHPVPFGPTEEGPETGEPPFDGARRDRRRDVAGDGARDEEELVAVDAVEREPVSDFPEDRELSGRFGRM